jgi:hypothetical protein
MAVEKDGKYRLVISVFSIIIVPLFLSTVFR